MFPAKFAAGRRKQRPCPALFAAKRLMPLTLISCFCLLPGLFLPVGAQEEAGSEVEYRMQEGGDRRAVREKEGSEGPVRLARFVSVSGELLWRSDSESEWAEATRNLPIRQGAEIWAKEGGRAEIQFDDGSLLRLGGGALVVLQTLYSDAEGVFTEITQRDGLLAMRLKHEQSVYQINTPLASIKAVGPAKFRCGVGEGIEVAVREGSVTIEGAMGKRAFEAGDYVDVPDDEAELEARRLPRADKFDQWVAELDRPREGERAERPSEKYLPANVRLVADELDDHGTWRRDEEHGYVWCPRVTVANWRPYHYGRWAWVSPFGWTWVSEEPWGWAPYHYGTWIHRSYGWAWVPGPVSQYWSPAAVHFYEVGSSVVWVPLAPAEVRYPSLLSVGVWGNRWSAFFSIGQAAVYYPTAQNVCVGQPWRSSYVNRVNYVYNDNRTIIVNRFDNRNRPRRNDGYIPLNARRIPGASMAELQNFAVRKSYQPVAPSAAALFNRAYVVSAPQGQGALPTAGPRAARPNLSASHPGGALRSGVNLPQELRNRPIYRARLNPEVERASLPVAGATYTPPARELSRYRGRLRQPGGSEAGSIAPGANPRSPVAGAPTRPESGIGRRESEPSETRPRDENPAFERGRRYFPGSRGTGDAAEAARRARESVNYPRNPYRGRIESPRDGERENPGFGRQAPQNEELNRYRRGNPYAPSNNETLNPFGRGRRGRGDSGEGGQRQPPPVANPNSSNPILMPRRESARPNPPVAPQRTQPAPVPPSRQPAPSPPRQPNPSPPPQQPRQERQERSASSDSGRSSSGGGSVPNPGRRGRSR